MVISPVSHYHKRHKSQAGMTLIEVLIALAISGIAMIAVIKAASQNIRSTSYLIKKTEAMWVAQEVLNEARADMLKMGSSSGNQRLKTEMLGQDWFWMMDQSETPNAQIKKVTVTVYENENDEADAAPIVTMESYVYRNE